MIPHKITKDGILINFRVIPRAKQEKIEGVYGDALKVRLQAPPVEGEANKALLIFLRKTTGLPAGSIQLVKGQQSRDKQILFLCSDQALLEKLQVEMARA